MKKRHTRQKQVIEHVISEFHTFFSADDVFEKVSKIEKNIGIATIYRFLKELRSEHKIFSYICNRRTVYSKEKSHCHFIDQNGNITHFDVENIDFLKDKVPGDIESFQIEVKGRK